MTHRKSSILTAVGMITLSAALIFHNFFRGTYSDFATGLLMGISIAIMIGAIVMQRCSPSQRS